MHIPHPPVLEEDALLRLAALDPAGKNQLLARVLKAFATSTERLLPQLEAAQDRVDLPGIRHVAHTLKSSSASIGAARLASLCAEVEGLARDGRTDQIAERLKALLGELELVQDEVKKRGNAQA